MERFEKCPYCKVPLTDTNSVFITIKRYDARPEIMIKKILLCTRCWDNAQIIINGRKNHDK